MKYKNREHNPPQKKAKIVLSYRGPSSVHGKFLQRSFESVSIINRSLFIASFFAAAVLCVSWNSEMFRVEGQMAYIPFILC